MNYEKKELEGGQIELFFEVPFDFAKPYLEKASARISNHLNIPGFRKGRAPYDIVKAHVGAQSVLEEAINDIVNNTLTEAIKKGDLKIVGMPKVEVEKLADGNQIQFKAVFDLEPDITLPDIENIKVKKEEIKIEESEADETIEAIRSIRAKEFASNEPIKGGDKAIIDFRALAKGKEIEGSKAEKYSFIAGEGKMIPGFEDALLGVKAGEEKTFELSFPKEYYRRELQGEKAMFEVKVNEVFSREKPELNDEFAKSLSPDFKTLDDYKKQVKESIKSEKERKQKELKEAEMLEKLQKKTEFSHIPKMLVASHKEKMIHDIEHSLEKQNKTDLKDYLKATGKTRDQFEQEIEEGAKKRVKTEFILMAFAKKNDIKVSDEEVLKEIEKIKFSFMLSKVDAPAHINSRKYKLYIKNSLIHEKTRGFLAEKIIS